VWDASLFERLADDHVALLPVEINDALLGVEDTRIDLMFLRNRLTDTHELLAPASTTSRGSDSDSLALEGVVGASNPCGSHRFAFFDQEDVSGLAEIAVGVGLLIPQTRQPAAWATVALLVAIFPANNFMTTSGVVIEGMPGGGDPSELVGGRLPLQGVLLLWAIWYT